MSKQKHFTTLILVLVVSIILIGAAFLVGRMSTKQDTVKVFEITEDVSAGQSLKGKYQQVEKIASQTVSTDVVATDASQIDNSYATVDMPKGMPVIKNLIRQEDKKVERNFRMSIPVTVQGTVANNLHDGELVAIRVNYKDAKPDATIVPKIAVTAFTNAQGKKPQEGEVPAFAILDLTAEEESLIDNAAKEGAVYLTKYNNTEVPALQQDYKVTEAQAPAK